MSRVANNPVTIPSGVEVNLGADREIKVKGSKGELAHTIHDWVDVA